MRGWEVCLSWLIPSILGLLALWIVAALPRQRRVVPRDEAHVVIRRKEVAAEAIGVRDREKERTIFVSQQEVAAAEMDVERTRKVRAAEIERDAAIEKAQGERQAVILKREAEAEGARAIGLADADVIRNKGLAEAEAIADLIESQTRAAARSAVRSLSGRFSELIHALVSDITRLRVYVEAAIDFPEEEVDFLSEGKVSEDLEGIISRLDYIRDLGFETISLASCSKSPNAMQNDWQCFTQAGCSPSL